MYQFHTQALEERKAASKTGSRMNDLTKNADTCTQFSTFLINNYQPKPVHERVGFGQGKCRVNLYLHMKGVSLNAEPSRIPQAGLIVPIVTGRFYGGIRPSTHNNGKTSKAFFSLTVRHIDSRSGFCNSSGEALHVGIRSSALRRPVHEISDGTNKQTNRQTHRIPVLL